MVPVAGAVGVGCAWAGTLGAPVRQPVMSAALQRLTFRTDRTLAPPTFTTYADPVCGTSASAFGKGLYPGSWFGEACSFGARCWQPHVTVLLHVPVLIAESVLSPWFTAKTASGAGYEQVYDIDEIIVRMPTPEEIERLDIPPGTPVAEHIRTGHTRTDVAVRVMISIVPGDTM